MYARVCTCVCVYMCMGVCVCNVRWGTWRHKERSTSRVYQTFRKSGRQVSIVDREKGIIILSLFQGDGVRSQRPREGQRP